MQGREHVAGGFPAVDPEIPSPDRNKCCVTGSTVA
jgi:hypothetical protein